MDIKIVRLHRITNEEGSIKGFVDISYNDELLLKGLRIIQGKHGPFISMPREKGKDGRWYELVQPLSKEVKEEISKVIIKVYEGGENSGL